MQVGQEIQTSCQRRSSSLGHPINSLNRWHHFQDSDSVPRSPRNRLAAHCSPSFEDAADTQNSMGISMYDITCLQVKLQLFKISNWVILSGPSWCIIHLNYVRIGMCKTLHESLGIDWHPSESRSSSIQAMLRGNPQAVKQHQCSHHGWMTDHNRSSNPCRNPKLMQCVAACDVDRRCGTMFGTIPHLGEHFPWRFSAVASLQSQSTTPLLQPWVVDLTSDPITQYFALQEVVPHGWVSVALTCFYYGD